MLASQMIVMGVKRRAIRWTPKLWMEKRMKRIVILMPMMPDWVTLDFSPKPEMALTTEMQGAGARRMGLDSFTKVGQTVLSTH